MAIKNWSKFLERLSKKLFADADESELELLAEDEPERFEKRQLGSAPASAAQVAAKEKALGVRLPDDYRAFLLASNGFRGMADLPHGLCSLMPVEQIAWFKTKDAGKGNRLEHYIEWSASGEKLPEDFVVSPEDYARTLLIGDSDGNECILLLPPRDESEEWEVWTYHPELGFMTGDTFTEFMESALEA